MGHSMMNVDGYYTGDNTCYGCKYLFLSSTFDDWNIKNYSCQYIISHLFESLGRNPERLSLDFCYGNIADGLMCCEKKVFDANNDFLGLKSQLKIAKETKYVQGELFERIMQCE